MIIAYCECVSVAQVTEKAGRMRRIILSAVDCTVVLYFYTLYHKRQYRKIFEHKNLIYALPYYIVYTSNIKPTQTIK